MDRAEGELVRMMATKDISDQQVCEAYRDGEPLGVETMLFMRTGQPEKVCRSAIKRAHRRGLIEYGVSLRSGWLTDAGRKMCE